MPCSIGLIDGETAFLTSDGERDSGFDSIYCTLPMWWSRCQGYSMKQ
ncbi:hypothetical protein ACODNH_21870 [Haloarcula sp. NS06]